MATQTSRDRAAAPLDAVRTLPSPSLQVPPCTTPSDALSALPLEWWKTVRPTGEQCEANR